MRPVYGQDEAVAKLVASLIPAASRGFGGDFVAMGVDHGGTLVGGFVLTNWSPEAGTIEISYAGIDRRWLTRTVLYAVFSYVFDDIGCQMAIAQTPARLPHAVRIARAYGFRQVAIPRLFGRDRDGIISTLTAEDWRSNGFHKEHRHGQGQGAEATQHEQACRSADLIQHQHCVARADDEHGRRHRNA